MTGYAICYGACYGCGRRFTFNPLAVPSVTVQGTREPFCLRCVLAANPIRVRNGLSPIVPAPDAYGPCSESELG